MKCVKITLLSLHFWEGTDLAQVTVLYDNYLGGTYILVHSYDLISIIIIYC